MSAQEKPRLPGAQKLRVLLAGLLCVSAATQAHHSYAEYDRKNTLEIEGRLVKADWANPHAELQLEVTGQNGEHVLYTIESSPLTYLRRMKVPIQLYAPGTSVKIAGWQSRNSPTRLYGTNILSAKGRGGSGCSDRF